MPYTFFYTLPVTITVFFLNRVNINEQIPNPFTQMLTYTLHLLHKIFASILRFPDSTGMNSHTTLTDGTAEQTPSEWRAQVKGRGNGTCKNKGNGDILKFIQIAIDSLTWSLVMFYFPTLK